MRKGDTCCKPKTHTPSSQKAQHLAKRSTYECVSLPSEYVGPSSSLGPAGPGVGGFGDQLAAFGVPHLCSVSELGTERQQGDQSHGQLQQPPSTLTARHIHPSSVQLQCWIQLKKKKILLRPPDPTSADWSQSCRGKKGRKKKLSKQSKGATEESVGDAAYRRKIKEKHLTRDFYHRYLKKKKNNRRGKSCT